MGTSGRLFEYGGASLGLVWGWLWCSLVVVGSTQPWRAGLAAAGATTTAAAILAALFPSAGWRAFLAVVAIGTLAHLVFRTVLVSRATR
jgi:hypothetical protein